MVAPCKYRVKMIFCSIAYKVNAVNIKSLWETHLKLVHVVDFSFR